MISLFLSCCIYTKTLGYLRCHYIASQNNLYIDLLACKCIIIIRCNSVLCDVHFDQLQPVPLQYLIFSVEWCFTMHFKCSYSVQYLNVCMVLYYLLTRKKSYTLLLLYSIVIFLQDCLMLSVIHPYSLCVINCNICSCSWRSLIEHGMLPITPLK